MLIIWKKFVLFCLFLGEQKEIQSERKKRG